MTEPITGRCLCGDVTYTINAEPFGAVSCHCKDCQRLHGIYNPMAVVDKDKVTITPEDAVGWYDSSEEKARGFCKKCGAALFMIQKQGPKILISVGSLDDTSGMKNVKNIFTEEAGEYYAMPPEQSAE